jgi:hypothetical protein
VDGLGHVLAIELVRIAPTATPTSPAVTQLLQLRPLALQERNFKHEGYHKVKCISKELGYRDNQGTRETMIYPEVHTLASANLRWRGAVA